MRMKGMVSLRVGVGMGRVGIECMQETATESVHLVYINAFLSCWPN